MARVRANYAWLPGLSRGALAMLTGAAFLAGCQQTVAFERLDAGRGGAGGAGGMAGNGTGGADNEICPMSERVMPLPDDVPMAIVALDRTTSMTTYSGSAGSGSKLDAVRIALLKVVNRYAAVVRFGLAGFPGKMPSSVGSCTPGSECCSSIMPSVFPLGFAGAMSFAIAIKENDFSPGAERQIAAALYSCISAFNAEDPNRANSHSVVLLTDGAPGCSAGDACKDAQSAALALKSDIHVLSLAQPPPDVDCLRTLNGGFGSEYDIADPRDARALDAKLELIFKGIASRACTLDLNIPADQITGIRVFQYGRNIPLGDGWTTDGANPWIKLTGDVCNTFAMSGPDTTWICRH